jgi:hypothetical protein
MHWGRPAGKEADQGKPISYEQPTRLVGSRSLAAMPEAAQNQWIVFLLDFLDDQTAGLNKNRIWLASGEHRFG